jgi:hypothetical protein
MLQLTLVCFKKIGLVYSRVGAGAESQESEPHLDVAPQHWSKQIYPLVKICAVFNSNLTFTTVCQVQF